MKRLLLIFAFTGLCGMAYAQSDTTKAKKTKADSIKLADSVVYTPGRTPLVTRDTVELEGGDEPVSVGKSAARSMMRGGGVATARTKGALSVSPSGSASYAVPIAVPPGIAGIAPQISLVYNSQSGNGIAGYGWNISGISAITRIPATKFHDGRIAGVNRNLDDRFALDGQRLLLKSGTYGTDGAVYQTENYSNLKIVSKGGDATGPDYFEVYYPDGTFTVYGQNTNTKTQSGWLINYTENASAIRINFSYTLYGNVAYLTQVSYGAKGSGTAINHVDFEYADCGFKEQAFIGGENIYSTKKLTRIEVSGNGTPYRNYDLTYDQVSTMGYDRLTGIQEKSGDESDSFEPITFSYPNSSSLLNQSIVSNTPIANVHNGNSEMVSGDFTGDGTMDFVVIPTSKDRVYAFWDPLSATKFTRYGTQHLLSSPISPIRSAFATSFLTSDDRLSQAQGLLLLRETNDSTFVIQVQSAKDTTSAAPLGFEYQKTWHAPSSPWYYSECDNRYFTNSLISREFFSGDFNGDGLSDLVAINHPYMLYTSQNSQCELIGSEISTASVHFINLDRRISILFASNAGSLSSSFNLTDKIYTGDFNGNGKTDLLQVRNGTMWVYELNDSNVLTLLWSMNDSEISLSNPLLPGDYNGDGKLDMMFSKTTSTFDFAVFTSTGTGFVKLSRTMPFPLAYHSNWSTGFFNSYLIPSDFNGDGKTDILRVTAQVSSGTSGDLTLIEFHNTGNSSNTDAATFSGGSSATLSGITLLHDPLTVFLDHKDPNFNLDFAILSNSQLRAFSFEKDIRNESKLTGIQEDGVDYTIDYKKVVTPEPGTVLLTDVKIYEGGNDQVFPQIGFERLPGIKAVSKLTRTFNSNTIQQVFGYRNAVSNTEGLGFLGFGETISSNWHVDNTDPNRMFTINVTNPTLRGATIKQFTSKNFSINATKKDVNQLPPDIVLSSAISTAQTVEATQSVTLLPGFEANGANGVFISQINNPSVGIADGASLSDYISRTDYTYKTELQSSKVFINVPTSVATKDLLVGTNTLQTYEYDSFYNPTKVVSSYSGQGTKTEESTYTNSTGSTWYIGRPLTSKTTINNGSDTYITETQWNNYSGFLPTQVKTKGHNTGWMTDNLTYDTYGNVTQKSTVSPGSVTRTVSMGYDASGRFMTSSTDVEGLTTTRSYNSSTGTLSSETNPYSQTTSYTYDSWNRFTQATDYLGKSSYRSYERWNGNLTITDWDDEGQEKITSYNALGNPVQTLQRDGLGQAPSVLYEYDVYDRQTKVSEPTLGTYQYNETEYDEYGRVKKSTAYTGKVTNISYNGLSVTANDGTQSITTTKNAMGQTASVQDPGGTITYSYFANGNLRSSTLSGVSQTIEQDGWGRKTKLTDPSAGVYTYAYNDFGETTQETTPKGTTNYTYEATTGKLTAKSVTGDNTSMSYSYTYNGTTKLLTAMSLTNGDGNNASYSYGYDGYQRLTSTVEDNTYARFAKTLTYDSFGRVATESNEAKNKGNNITVSRAVTHNYQFGELKSITDNATGTVLHNLTGLNGRGQLTEAYMGGSTLKQANTYDSYGLPTELKTNRLSGTPAELMKLSFSFNTQRGNLDSRSNNAFSTAWSESFSYDNLDRLTNFNDNNGNKSQSYDGQGRITASSRLGTYTYDTSSPYRQIGLSNLSSYALYHYQTHPQQTITYNAFKSPVEIYEQGKERISYQYNASESRAHAYYGSDNSDKMARPMRRHYSEDGSMEITEDLANSKTSFVFYLGGDAYSAPAIYKEEHSSSTTGNLYYLHRDHLGSINLITDASGNIVEKRQFDAWGSIVKLEDGSGNALSGFLILDRGYTGHEHLLGVGLINMNARLYDPVLHRFLSPDNYVQDPTNSQNFNRYGYVMNNPLKYTDASGEFFWLAIAAGAIIGGASGGAAYAGHAIKTGDWSWGKFGASVLGGAAIGGLTGGINPTALLGTSLGSSVGAAFVSGIMPSANFSIGNFGFSISPAVAFGQSFGIGANLSVSYTSGNFSISGGVGYMAYGNYNGFGTAGSEIRASIAGAWDNGSTGISLGSNNWSSSGGMTNFDQRTGSIGFRSGDFSVLYENDGGFGIKNSRLGDRGDKYRSAALNLSYKDFTAGFNLFTGYRELDPPGSKHAIVNETDDFGRKYKRGFVDERGTHYRLGTLTLGYGGYRAGVNSEHVRHAIQDRVIHGMIGDAGFRNRSWNWGGYSQYRTRNRFSSW